MHRPFNFIRSVIDRHFRPRYVNLIVHVDVLREMGGHWADIAESADAHRSVFMPKYIVRKLSQRFDPIANMQKKLDAGENVSLIDPAYWLATTPLSSGRSAQSSPSEGEHSSQIPLRSAGGQ